MSDLKTQAYVYNAIIIHVQLHLTSKQCFLFKPSYVITQNTGNFLLQNVISMRKKTADHFCFSSAAHVNVIAYTFTATSSIQIFETKLLTFISNRTACFLFFIIYNKLCNTTDNKSLHFYYNLVILLVLCTMNEHKYECELLGGFNTNILLFTCQSINKFYYYYYTFFFKMNTKNIA